MKETVAIYDTTLRDGSQGEGISFSLEDKLKIVSILDKLGVDYIEGGWPGSNPKDELFFRKARELKLENSRIAAFSSTRRPGIRVEDDPNIAKLAAAGAEVVAVFAKSWDFHVSCALEISLEENLAMIYDTVKYLKDRGLTVFFDAEHFFDGYNNNREYALKTLTTAVEAGADLLVLCDTNGGQLPSQIGTTVHEVRESITTPLGIHAHDDSGLGVANTLAACEAGTVQVQGTIGGLGERVGNADLCSSIPALVLKQGRVLNQLNLSRLTSAYYSILEIANQIPANNHPYVGKSAFTHKGGIHVSALQKNPATYEHISPEIVGNRRRVLISELAGKSNLKYKLEELGFDPARFDKQKLSRLISKVKELENQGYQFEGAEGSLRLLISREYLQYTPFFKVDDFKIITHSEQGEKTLSEAVVKLWVKGEKVHVASEGDGPVNALDNALRKALNGFFPGLDEMKLIDYKVRVINGNQGTAAKVRVLVETADQGQTWTTVGVSTNIIQASWQAITDSIEYGLLQCSKDQEHSEDHDLRGQASQNLQAERKLS